MNSGNTTQASKAAPGSATIGAQRIRAGSNTVISVIGAAVILIAINYLGMRHYARGDWTSSGIYTLSDKSTKTLQAVEKDIQLYALWSQADPRFLDVKELLDRYMAATPRIKLEVVDPDLNQDRMEFIINRYGAKMRDIGGGMMAIEASIIAVSGENVKFVSSADFEDFSNDMLGGHGGHEAPEEMSSYKAEQALTAAILNVTSGEQAKICFTQGHGEWGFEGFSGRGLGALKEGLVQDGYKVEAVSTRGASRIPPGCDAVVVVGPQNAFIEEESSMLDAYLRRGGRLLLLLDPVIDRNQFVPTGLERLAARSGIKLSQDVILETDPRRLVSSSPFTFTASEFTSHQAVKQLAIPDSVGAEIKKQLGAYPVVFSMARSLALKEDSDTVADVLAKSSESSWGEVDLASLGTGESVPSKDQYDSQGPNVVAIAASLPTQGGKDEGGRLVVVGDSDFLSEELFVNAGLNNRDFWSGLVGWLTSRGDLISIAPKNPEHVRLNLTENDIKSIWQIVIGEILFCIVLGVVVWMKRRS
ncbi:MAG: GldG family protein [Proteobacteria bacterium]|nr:GldG family protein [Pseudomonadota bacterium]